MQIIRYKSSGGVALGMARNSQLIGYFQPNSELHDLLRLRADELRMQIENSFQHGAANNLPTLILAPIDGETEVWAAGVTYKQSEQARMEESGTPDIYANVYAAKRPELFFKATPRRVAGPDAPIVVRTDSTWDVPEPELVLVVNAHAEIHLAIERNGQVYWEGETSTRELKRRFDELVTYLFLENDFPDGVFLYTGTALVPERQFTLEPGDVVQIDVDQLGTLRNPVVRGKVK